MTIHQTDFSEYTADQTPSDWNCYNSLTNTPGSGDDYLKVRALVGATGGKVLAYNDAGFSTTGANRIFIWTGVPSTADYKALMRWRAVGQNGSDLRMYARATDQYSDAADGYTLGVRGGDLDINKLTAGAFSNLNNDAGGYTATDGAWYRTELRLTGTTLEVRSWPEGGTIPSVWLTDTDSAHASGLFGLLAFQPDTVQVDWLTVTTAGETPTEPGVSTPTITNIDTDNAVSQYQQAIVNVSGFTEAITSVTLGGTACTVPENDPTDDQITVGVPGSLTTGTYDLVISGATETDTLTGVSYTQTHARPAFDGLVDSNSILSGQSYTADTYFRFVTSFSNGTLDLAAGDAREWQDDIADYYTPNEGFTGDDTASIEFLYSDGTTSAAVGVTITVEAPDTVGPVVQSVAVPTARTYTPGENLDFTANMDEASFVTGTPALGLLIGGSARQANYVSGDGTQALLFRYPVQSGDEDTDGIEVTGLTLDGGTIKDSAGNDATLTLNAVGDTSGVLVDGVAPVISINSLTTTDTTPVVSGSAGDAVSLTLVVDGVTYNPTPSGGAWSQQLNTLAPGTYTMTLDGQDSAGNPATQQTATLTVNEVPPLVSRQRFKMSIETTTIRMSL